MLTSAPTTPFKSPLPDLPPEIWVKIASHLTLSDLSALSQTSHQFHRGATTEELFRDVFEKRTGNTRLPDLSPSYANLFRRSCAIRRLPTPHPCPPQPAAPRILACAADTVVLYARSANLLFAHPAGWSRPAQQVCDEVTDLPQCCVILPGARLGFLHSMKGRVDVGTGQRWSQFRIVDMRTGEDLEQVSLPLGPAGVADATLHALSQPKALFLAGQFGQLLCYFLANASLLRVVDYATGSVVADISVQLGYEFASLVRGTSVDVDGFVVLGVVEADDNPDFKKARTFRVRPFDRQSCLSDRIVVDPGYELVDVVQRCDGKVCAYRVRMGTTKMTLWRQEDFSTLGVPEHQSTAGARSRRRRRIQNGTNTCLAKCPVTSSAMENSSLLRTSEVFRMTANGRCVLILPSGVPQQPRGMIDGRVVRVSFDDTGFPTTVTSMRGAFEYSVRKFSWARLCQDNRVLVTCSQLAGLISAFDFQSGRKLWSCQAVESLADVTLIGEHYFLGVGRDSGRLHAWHFDSFCPQVGRHPLSITSLTVGSCMALFQHPSRNNSATEVKCSS